MVGVVEPGALVSLESTTYPGTTDDVIVGALDAEGFRIDEDVFVAYSPERVDPGSRVKLRSIPKVVGGVSPRSARVAEAAYGRLVDRVHSVSSAKVCGTVETPGEHIPIGQHCAGERDGPTRQRSRCFHLGDHRCRRHQAVWIHAVLPRGPGSAVTAFRSIRNIWRGRPAR